MNYIRFLKNYYKGYLKAQFKPLREYLDALYKNIGILNPTIRSKYLGDQIIYESLYKYLREIYMQDLITNFPTQIYTLFDALVLMRKMDLISITGTNLLSSNLETINKWKIHKANKIFIKYRVVLFGCGWLKYHGNVDRYKSDIYTSVLNNDLLHSARDQYTVDKLNSIGIKNVVDTTCPTLWCLTPEKIKKNIIIKGNT